MFQHPRKKVFDVDSGSNNLFFPVRSPVPNTKVETSMVELPPNHSQCCSPKLAPEPVSGQGTDPRRVKKLVLESGIHSRLPDSAETPSGPR
jgi:hypothetical protein